MKPPATFGLTARPSGAPGSGAPDSGAAGKIVLAVYRDHDLLADLEFTPRQWVNLVRRGGAIAEDLMREEEA